MSTNQTPFMKNISILNNDRRKDIRHSVICNALLNVCFPDFQDDIAITVSNLSSTGALIYSDQVFVRSHHIISIYDTPKLNLKIKLPEEYFETPVEIRWYKWCVKKNCFEIGVNFILKFKHTRITVNKFITKLKSKTSDCLNF